MVRDSIDQEWADLQAFLAGRTQRTWKDRARTIITWSAVIFLAAFFAGIISP